MAIELSEKQFYRFLSDERDPKEIHTYSSGATRCGLARSSFTELVGKNKLPPIGWIRRGEKIILMFRSKDLDLAASATAKLLQSKMVENYKRLAGVDPAAAIRTLEQVGQYRKQLADEAKTTNKKDTPCV